MKNNWYIITGAPSTGKTTLLRELAKRGHLVLPEMARTIIDERIASGENIEFIRADERIFQEQVASRKAALEASLDKQTRTFLDRGMHDTLAYMNAHNFEATRTLEELLLQSSYRKVFILEPLSDFTDDYARNEDAHTRSRLQELLIVAYTKYGMEPVKVPEMSVAQRADFVLNIVEEDIA